MDLFCSLIPHLQSEKGHYFSYHTCVQEAVEKLGLSFRAYISEQCTIDCLPSHWVKKFPRKSFRFAQKARNAWLRWITYVRLFRHKTPKRHYFFLECFREKELFLVGLAALLFFRPKDRLLLLYRYDFQTFWMKGKVLQFLTSCLRKRLGNRLIALTDSELILQELNPWFQGNAHLLPIPHTKPSHKERRTFGPSYRFWWAGEPKDAKGRAEIQMLLQGKAFEESKITLVVAQSACLQEGGNAIQVERIGDILSREQYEEQMQGADAILVPYHQDCYRVGTSGVFVEAVVSGKIPFTKEGTWIAYELRKFGLEELILDWRHPRMLSHMLKIMQDVQMQQKLLQMRQIYKQFHCLKQFSHSLQKAIEHSK